MPSEPPLSDADLPDDPAALRALLAASRTENADLAEEVARPKAILAAFRRALFGRRSEKRDPDQLEPALEEASQELAEDRAKAEAADAPPKKRRAARRRARRGSLPPHLPRIETVVEPERTDCPGCGGALHRIGEDRAERLDVIPAQFRVPVTRRPRYARRGCADGVVQAPAPPRLIAKGLPTEATAAHVLVSKFAEHLPLHRRAGIFARQGVALDRSTLADWVGHAARELRPVHARLVEILKASPKLFADETRAPVLDPGRGRTKTGRLWALGGNHRISNSWSTGERAEMIARGSALQTNRFGLSLCSAVKRLIPACISTTERKTPSGCGAASRSGFPAHACWTRYGAA